MAVPPATAQRNGSALQLQISPVGPGAKWGATAWLDDVVIEEASVDDQGIGTGSSETPARTIKLDDGAGLKNVLFVPIDDQRPCYKSYGDGCVSPAHDRLAKEGMIFTRAFANFAWCAPR